MNIMKEQAFAARLRQACDNNPNVPPVRDGAQAWVRRQLSVSHAAVSKWFLGQSRPKAATMSKLAKILNVDEAWLALGVEPAGVREPKLQRQTRAKGAANVFMGLMQVHAARVAVPADDDPAREYVDFYAIMHGQHLAFHVSLATLEEDGTLLFQVPNEYRRCTVIGAIPMGGMQLDFIRLPPELIDEHGDRRGGYIDVRVNRGAGKSSAKNLQVKDFDFIL